MQENLINQSPAKSNQFELTKDQLRIAEFPAQGSLFVSGPAGSGKTTAAVERLCRLSSQIDDPDSILILTPQRSLAAPYLRAIRSPDFLAPSPHSILTIGGLAQRSIMLFWPIIAREAGFKQYKKPPVFLTLETAQFYLAQIIDPLLEKGYFEGITVDRLRLLSQIIDNLNKSAVIDFSPENIASRLSTSWTGKTKHSDIFSQAQECALLFRQYCLDHNLLDFSLQVSVFSHYLWKSFIFRQYLNIRYQHLIYDNAEEDYPVAHDMVADWLLDLKSAVILVDDNGGFRTFLGADSISANRFSKLTSSVITLNTQFTSPASVSSLSTALSDCLLEHRVQQRPHESITKVFDIQSFRFFPEALDHIARQVKTLIDEKEILPNEIAILTPFLSDSLLFSAANRFAALGVPITAFRPSRGLKDEPAVKAVLTLAKLAFPAFNFVPTREDVRNTFLTTIEGCDLIRADLLAQMLYTTSGTAPLLRAYDPVKNEMRSRLTAEIGDQFGRLRNWLLNDTNSEEQDFDVFLGRLFGELLSQPGFCFHSNADNASIIKQLIDSCRRFRGTIQSNSPLPAILIGIMYIELVEKGVFSSQFLSSWESQEVQGLVLIAPAHSFLMRNNPVKIQFWLDIGSQGWWTRLDQPLTQPYVLSRNWKEGTPWTDMEEYSTNQRNLSKIISGLLNRCSEHVTMVAIDINQQGNEERGSLMVAVQNLLKYLNQNEFIENV